MAKSRRQSRSTRSPDRLKIAVSIAALSIFIGILSLLNRVFVIRTIGCQLSDRTPCSQEIYEQFTHLRNRSVFFLDLQSYVTQSLTPLYPVSLAEYHIFLPDRLEMVLDVETPLYQLVVTPTELLNQSPKNNQMLIVSQRGLVFDFDHQPHHSLPIVYLPHTSMTEQQKPQSQVHQILENIIQLTKQLDLNLEQIKWHDELTIELKLNHHQEIFMIDSLETNKQLQQLSVLINAPEYQTISQHKQEVDLRFELPVLRTSP